jgi:hypothetical protein
MLDQFHSNLRNFAHGARGKRGAKLAGGRLFDL